MIERMLEAERDLAVGLVDRAEEIYRGLAEGDARNAVAVVGLARCALERGDEHRAYELAVRALAIDPDDAAALRMEARLSEVLATRGERVERPALVADGGASGAESGGTTAGGTASGGASGAVSNANAAGDPATGADASAGAGGVAGGAGAEPTGAGGGAGNAPARQPTQATAPRPGLLRRMLGRR